MAAVAKVGAARSGRSRLDFWSAATVGTAVAVAVVILALLLVVAWLSFHEGDPGAPNLRWSLANFEFVFLDTETYRVLANTVVFSAATLAVALLIGLPAAWLSERTDLPLRSVLFAAMTVGLLIPGFASAMGWLYLLHPRIGLANVALRDVLDIAGPGPFSITTALGMGWVQGINLAPVAFIMTAAVFRAADPSLEESAAMSGASFRHVLRRITLPIAWPGILAASIYIFMIGFAAFDVPAIIGLSNRVFTFSTFLFQQLNATDVLPRYGVAAALSAAVIAVALPLSWWYAKMQSQAFKYQVVKGKGYRPTTIALGRWKSVAWAFLGGYFLLSLVLPTLVLVWSSITPYMQMPSVASFRTVSLSLYADLPWSQIWMALGNTGILMFLSPTITLAVSLAFTWVVLRSQIPGRSQFDLVAFLPHAVPNIIFAVGALLIALYVLRDVAALYGSLTLLLVVFVVTRISYGTRMTNSGLIQIHQELEECAYVSGANTGGALRHVVIPLLTPTLIYAWLWIALLALRELTLAVVLTTRDNITLPVVVWSLWTGGKNGEASAIAVIMLLMMAPIVTLYWFVARKRGSSALS